MRAIVSDEDPAFTQATHSEEDASSDRNSETHMTTEKLGGIT